MFEKRESYKKRFPEWTQPFITWLVGVPYRGQRPIFKSNPYLELLATIAWACIGFWLLALGVTNT